MSGFKASDQKGFHVTFENGWTVSVQFGPYNYCSVRSLEGFAGDHVGPGESPDAEIAAWPEEGDWHRFENGDTVEGWQKPDDVLAFMVRMAAL